MSKKSRPNTYNKTKSFLAECVFAMTMIPDSLLKRYQLVPTGNESVILDTLRERQYAVSAWLTHLFFNRGRKTPDHLQYTYLKSYKEDALYSESVLKLAEGVCDISNNLSFFKPDDISDSDLPAWFWLSCEFALICAEIQSSGLGLSLGIPDLTNPGRPATKEGAVKFLRQRADFLEDLISEIKINEVKENEVKDNEQELPFFLRPLVYLEAEGKRIAQTDEDFTSRVWTPYVKAQRRWANIVRKNLSRQAIYLQSDGSILRTAKNQKQHKGFG